MQLLLSTLLISLVLTGCSNRLQQPEYKSGFLKDYRFFKANPNTDNSWVRTKPGFRLTTLKQYRKIALNPIEIWLDPNNAANINDKEKQAKLTAYFEQKIKEKVGDKYEFVQPGTKDSLLIKMALTNIEELEPELSPLDIMPYRIAMNIGEQFYLLASAQKAVIGAASLEIEFVDTNSQRGIVAVIVSNKTSEVNVSDDEINIESVKHVVDDWVDRLAKALTPLPKI